MKIIVAALLLVSYSQAAEFQFTPRGAYLVVQPQPNATTTSTTTPSPQRDSNENVEALNAQIMERLRQEVGSEKGVYHVYLADGRLQRVQYTTAPVASQASAQQPSQVSTSEKQEEEPRRQVEGAVQGVYYVQVPEERLQALRAYPAPAYPLQQTEQTAQSGSFAQYNQSPTKANAQYNQESAEAKAEYLPITVVSVDQLSSYRAPQTTNPVFQGESSSQERTGDSGSDSQVSARQQQSQQEYIASLQYTQVEPISGPVYSYSPQQLVRILRYAPVHA